MPNRAVSIECDFFPPGVNNLYANVQGRGRVKTKRHREWAAAAGWAFNGHQMVKGEFELNIILSKAKKRKNQDLDGLLKAPIDLLVAHGIVEDDSLCQKITVALGDCKGFHIEVWPYFRPL